MQRSLVRAGIGLAIALVAAVLAKSFIWTQSGLENWCKSVSKDHLLAKGKNPVDWSSPMSSFLGDDLLSVYGNWKVGSEVYVVQCSAPVLSPYAGASYQVAEQ
ncbi:MAG: hypothetical protein KDA57_17905 [Planctomycetales bacterium]|nr:hypothetical protein [Planctomycetales bacterium]MCA9232529.1 hypothetical protein [Planctomycetales bacterium]